MRNCSRQIRNWQTYCAVLLLISPAVVMAGKSASSSVGLKVVRSSSAATSPCRFLLQSIVEPALQRSAVSGPRIEFPRSPRVSRSYSPLRNISLLGGERVLAEIVRWDETRVDLRLRTGQTVSIPRLAISSIGPPEGEIEMVYESFESNEPEWKRDDSARIQQFTIQPQWLDRKTVASGRSSLNLCAAAEPLVYRFTDKPHMARVQFWFRTDNPFETAGESNESRSSGSFQVAFEFDGKDAAPRWELQVVRGRASMLIHGPQGKLATRQSIVVTRGWHRITAVFSTDHAICAMDDSLLISSGSSAGQLQSMRLSATETASAWIDCLQISRIEMADAEQASQPSTQDDCIALLNGDQWFGHVASVDSVSLGISGQAGNRSLAWNQIRSATLRQPNQPARGKTPSKGIWSNIEFQPFLDRPRQRSDRIRAAIKHIERDFMIVDHPWLGEFAIDWADVSCVEPLFVGQMIPVDSRTLHLGDAIRPEFHQPVPEGTDWSAEFTMPGGVLTPGAQTWLAMDVVELEPSGPGTPPASAFLKDLRAGRLLTQLMVNDSPADNLNRWIHYRAPVDHPERLRCRLPIGLFREGRNTVRLRQIAQKPSGMYFDNCEISNLAIEIVDGPEPGR